MTYQQYPRHGAYPPPGIPRGPNGATGILAILGGIWFLAGVAFHIIELSLSPFRSSCWR